MLCQIPAATVGVWRSPDQGDHSMSDLEQLHKTSGVMQDRRDDEG